MRAPHPREGRTDGRRDGAVARRLYSRLKRRKPDRPTATATAEGNGREDPRMRHGCNGRRTRMSRRRRPSAVWRISNARSFCGSHLSSRESPRTEVRNRGKILPPCMSRCVESQTKAFLAREHELNSDFKGVGRRASFQFRPFVLAHGYLVRTSKAPYYEVTLFVITLVGLDSCYDRNNSQFVHQICTR